jgi:hypothetical protein
MPRTIEPVTEHRGAAALRVLDELTEIRPPVAERADQREERAGDAALWSFEQAFEQACADVQAMFRRRGEFEGLLLIGVETGLLVAMPFAWDSEAERAWLYERLSRDYQGRAEYYIHATESSGGAGARGKGGAAMARILTVVGMDREQTTFSRCWQIKEEPVPRLVEQRDVPRTRETLSEVLFSRFRPAV